MPINDKVLPLAERLLACLCTQLAETVGGAACDCCLHAGMGPPPADYCACDCTGPDGRPANGQAWVKVQRIFPAAARFPAQAFDAEACRTNTWGAELLFGVYRCVSVPNDDGDPPPCDDITNDTIMILEDAAAMRRAATCCFPTVNNDPRAIVGAYEPLGPNGGCAGGQMTITVEFYDCCPDPADPADLGALADELGAGDGQDDTDPPGESGGEGGAGVDAAAFLAEAAERLPGRRPRSG